MGNKLAIAALIIIGTPLQAATPPGHPSTEQAAEALGLPTQIEANTQGVVKQAIDSNSYTYIAVILANGEERWLAAPRIALRPGSRIAFGEGARMTNFYSKKLRRTFSSILFVPGVDRLVD